jgi:SAM-dependent methyltransferase
VSWAVKGQTQLQHLLHRSTPLVDLSFVGFLDFKWQLGLCFGAMFCACMVCHGELVRLRPAPRRLTEYYLWIAAGGALGGMLVSLAAPAAFNTFHEWPLGLIACYTVALLALGLAGRGRLWKSLGLAAITPVVVLGVWEIGARLKPPEGEVENPASAWQQKLVERARNFYGVLSVYENDWDNPDQHRFTLQHGGIIHGEQFTDPEKNFRPSNYYVEQSGIGQTINYFRQRGKVRVGVVGLGTGSLAVYARSGDVYRFYEINPEVPRLAKKYFTYLSRCQGKCEVVMGDARLSLEREPPQSYNVLALDAFSGDAIPTHMLTEEAIAVFRRHLAPDGVLAIHITNSYLRLTPVVKGLADHSGYKCVRIYVDSSYEPDAYTSDWILLTKNDDFVRAVPSVLPWDANKDQFRVPLWTDRYSNLFRILEYQSPSGTASENEDDL